MAYLYSGIIIANPPKFICVFFPRWTDKAKARLCSHATSIKIEAGNHGKRLYVRKESLHEQISKRGEEKIVKYKNILIPIQKWIGSSTSSLFHPLKKKILLWASPRLRCNSARPAVEATSSGSDIINEGKWAVRKGLKKINLISHCEDILHGWLCAECYGKYRSWTVQGHWLK